MSKNKQIEVRNEQEREDVKLELAVKGYETVMETDTQTVMKLQKRRTWLWLILCWPVLLIKKTEIATIRVVN